MRFTIALALGASQMASALSNHTTSPTPTGEPRPTPSLPTRVGPFRLYGCAVSADGFPGFRKAASRADMDLQICAATCKTFYFGVFDTDCYCGDSISRDNISTKPEMAQCNIRCPGMFSEACGGRPHLLQRREVDPRNAALSLYERVDVEPPTTIHTTHTSTGVMTACPPGKTDCPPRHHGDITINIHNTIICIGDFCAAEINCPTCKRQRVICKDDDDCHTEECEDDDNHWSLVKCTDDHCRYPKCKGDECKRKIVCKDGKCKKDTCHEDECEKKFVCKDDDCKHEKCHGDECYKKWVCKNDDCKVKPVCDDECVAPPAKKKAEVKPVAPKVTQAYDHDVVVVAGSGKVAVIYNILAAAVGLALML
ncbi:hypothetical protein DCS_01388 [Drechmeria coniospora]|uniref:WSC domain-containing protein n=1 Tax=Drechmeria coniospora TaxID=98403 RepID=A0A151GT56_DRECN|nr:hypothetical protein DCS_01388 [Drechmeria coniospora]KYK60251.1 hypothetical protein DCS_01388 [Drechmeria coniospora]ODA80193.1 hypothetical protein RJ55_03151 [Drechmeria coniospora]